LLRPFLAGYVELLRGTPLLLQLLFLYYGILPYLGLPDAWRGARAVIAAITRAGDQLLGVRVRNLPAPACWHIPTVRRKPRSPSA
jgi:ABC-type amino acid transport system permease subunit